MGTGAGEAEAEANGAPDIERKLETREVLNCLKARHKSLYRSLLDAQRKSRKHTILCRKRIKKTAKRASAAGEDDSEAGDGSDIEMAELESGSTSEEDEILPTDDAAIIDEDLSTEETEVVKEEQQAPCFLCETSDVQKQICASCKTKMKELKQFYWIT